MHRILTSFVLCALCLASVRGDEIELPKGYIEKLEAKRIREAATLWREIDRTEVERAIRSFVAANPIVGGVDLSASAERFDWRREKPRWLRCGSWSLWLAEWEVPYPALRRLAWDKATLVVSLPYDRTTKRVGDGGAEVRLFFGIERRGGVFEAKVLHPRFQSMDYGEVVVFLPFGGVELQKDGQPGATDNPDDAQRLREDH